jgi:hypothetical protein
MSPHKFASSRREASPDDRVPRSNPLRRIENRIEQLSVPTESRIGFAVVARRGEPGAASAMRRAERASLSQLVSRTRLKLLERHASPLRHRRQQPRRFGPASHETFDFGRRDAKVAKDDIAAAVTAELGTLVTYQAASHEIGDKLPRRGKAIAERMPPTRLFSCCIACEALHDGTPATSQTDSIGDCLDDRRNRRLDLDQTEPRTIRNAARIAA